MLDEASIPRAFFSTEEVPDSEKYDAWHAGLSEVFSLEQIPEKTAPHFEGIIESYLIGSLLLNRSQSTPQIYRRTSRHIALNGVDHIMVELVLTGRHLVRSQNIDKILRAGDVVLYDLAQENYLITDSQKQPNGYRCQDLDVVLPRARIESYLPGVERLHQHVIPAGTPLNQIIRQQMLTLHQLADGMSIHHASAVADAFSHLLVGLFTSDDEVRQAMSSEIDRGLLAYLLQLIDQNLSDSRLSAAFFERALNVSRSRLYRLCEPWGGVTHMIRRRRLNHAYRLLIMAAPDSSITQIAFQCGFTSSDSFSRAFKQAFSLRPSDVFRSRLTSRGETVSEHPWGLDTRYVDWAKRCL